MLSLSSLLALTATAASFSPSGMCTIEFTLKKADVADVVKDGVIGQYEYERVNVSTDPADTPLGMGFGEAQYYGYAENMLKTMEYYFSWDDTHGLNFAVRFKPECTRQVFDQGTADPPLDDFLANVGIQFSGDPNIAYDEAVNGAFTDIFYVAIAKRTDTGEYLYGHYNQLGLNGDYTFAPGQDYVINYESDGHVVCEWSIPFRYFTTTYAPGNNVYFTIAVTGALDQDHSLDSFNSAYSVSFGDFGFLMKQAKGESQNVTAVVSSETLRSSPDTTVPGTTAPDTTTPSTTKPIETKVNDEGKVVVVETTTNEKGEVVVVEREATAEEIAASNNTPAAQTADPIIAVAAVCALSAGAVLTLRKKK